MDDSPPRSHEQDHDATPAEPFKNMNGSDEAVISVQNVNHFFGDGESRKQVLVDNNLVIGPGEFVIMTGPSGSGKTTLLTLIGALRSVQEGSVRILGHELCGLRGHELVAVRRNIGFIFQMHNLFDSLTAFENVKMAMQLHSFSAKEMRDRGTEMLAKLGLDHRINYKPRALSGGQRQRVAIARALVSQPRLILADEPTAALDRKSGRDVVDLLKERTRRDKATILLVTHDNRILDVADRIVNMIDGRVATDISVDASARICEFLKRAEVLASLSPTEIFNVAQQMGSETHPADTTIIRQGDPGEKFYVIAKGTVDIVVKENGTSRVVTTLSEGDCFGELALISGEPRSATVISREPVLLYTLGREKFKATLEANESFREQLLKVFFQRQ